MLNGLGTDKVSDTLVWTDYRCMTKTHETVDASSKQQRQH